RVSVFGRVYAREFSLPDIAQMAAAWRQVISPGVYLLLQAAASGVFPLRFGREALAGPAAILSRIVPGDVRHRVLLAPLDIRTGALGLLPVRAADLAPPCDTTDSVFHQLARNVGMENERPVEFFGFGAVSGSPHEFRELAVRYRIGIHVERIERDFAHGAFAISREASFPFRSHHDAAPIPLYHV